RFERVLSIALGPAPSPARNAGLDRLGHERPRAQAASNRAVACSATQRRGDDARGIGTLAARGRTRRRHERHRRQCSGRTSRRHFGARMIDEDIIRLEKIARLSEDRHTRAGRAAECIRAARGYRWVGLYDVRTSHIIAIAWTGSTAPAHPSFPRSQGLNGVAVRTGSRIVVQDVREDGRYLTTFGTTRA